MMSQTHPPAAKPAPSAGAVFGGGTKTNPAGPARANAMANSALGPMDRAPQASSGDAVLMAPPRERPAQQWAHIRAVWEDRQGEPQSLMQRMVDCGFDVADLAYATGQSLAQVGRYLSSNGAADGFANWTAAHGFTGAASIVTAASAPAPTSPDAVPCGSKPGRAASPPSSGVNSSQMHQVLGSPPRERPQKQWDGIKAVWEDRNDEPGLLMQLMIDFGFDAADIAYATGQSLAQVGNYLLTKGAADGFAGWTASRGYLGTGRLQGAAATGAPRLRPPQQWADIKAAWDDRKGEPALLMLLMLEHGFDAADIAYATGQSADELNLYLIVNGAPAGFANSTAMDRQAVERHYMQALRQSLSASMNIDQFTTQYIQSGSLEGRVFAQLHGASSTVALDVPDKWGRTPTVTTFLNSGATLLGTHLADGRWTVQTDLKTDAMWR
jgi:hypothetical protein